MFPEKIDAIWDELVADAVGIYGALGRFDPELEKLFLGIKGELYTGGRLENYVEEEDFVFEGGGYPVDEKIIMEFIN